MLNGRSLPAIERTYTSGFRGLLRAALILVFGLSLNGCLITSHSLRPAAPLPESAGRPANSGKAPTCDDLDGATEEVNFGAAVSRVLHMESGSEQIVALKRLYLDYLVEKGWAEESEFADEDEVVFNELLTFADENMTLTPEQEKEIALGIEGTSYDIPMSINRKVEGLIRFYATKRRDTVLRAFERAGEYEEIFQHTLEKHNMPRDLAYLCLIESAYKPKITSHASARGLWQFIPGTARKYGLKIDYFVDERCDPEKATEAACQYLSMLYQRYNDWYLALAAYNCGEGCIDRVVKRTGITDFWRLAQRRRTLPKETMNYVPAYLAAVVISKNPDAYGLQPDPLPPLDYDLVEVPDSISLEAAAHCAGTTMTELKRLNPELRRWCTPPVNGSSYLLKVPKGTGELFAQAYANLGPEHFSGLLNYTVQGTETLASIAKTYQTSTSLISKLNSLRSTRLKAGQVLVVPHASKAGEILQVMNRSKVEDDAYTPAYLAGKRFHKVRSGETVGAIARRYRVSAENIRRWNGLNRSFAIRVGQKLTIYGKGSSPEPVEAKVVKASAPSSEGIRKIRHVVRRGEAVYSIANHYGVSAYDIKKWNGLNNRFQIKAGQELVIYLSQASTKPGQTAKTSRASVAPPPSGVAVAQISED